VNPIEETVQLIPLKDISVASNVRSDMDAKKLDELEAMVRASGMAQPIELRPSPLFEETYIVTFGHRRLEIAKRLGWKDVPAIVRERTDDEVDLLQLQENEGREDLHALDRAAHYKKLSHERGWEPARIAKAVGKARSTVELTLRLADLTDAGKKALRDGWLPQGAAEELALLSPAVQKDGLKLLEQLDHDGELNRAKAKEVLRRELLLDLAEVKFDPRDAHLVPDAGACIPDCTKRTGAQPDLFGGKGPDCCTDRACLRVKEGAWLRLQEKAGVKVLSSAEVKQVFPYEHSSSVSRDSGYALADEKDYHHPKSATYRAQLGKEAKTKVVLARGPDGELVELVARKDLPKPEKAAAPKNEASAAEKRRALEQKATREAVTRALTDIGQHLAGGKLGQYDADVAELVLRALLRESHKDTKVALAKVLLLEPDKSYDGADSALLKHYETTEKKRKTPGWDFVALLSLAPALLSNPIYHDQGSLEDLKKFLKLLGAGDFAKVRADVEREYREAEKMKATKKAATAGAKTAKRKEAARDGKLDLSDGPIIRWAEHRDGKHLRIGKGRSGLTYTVTRGSASMGNTFTLQAQSPAQLKAGGASVHGIWPDGSSAKITSVQHAVELADALEERELKDRMKAAGK
jgi:ParB/RepB/Spo0J family partition protein